MLKLSVATANTSNVTDRHRGPKRKLRAGYTAPSLQPRSFTQRHQLRHYNARYIFLSSSVVSRAFSALCVYSKFRHHPHLPGYFWAKFRFCGALRCWAI